jgi:hypothetical protein
MPYDEVRDEIEKIHEGVGEIREKIAEHEVRFGNGREVMAEIKKDVESLKPKAPDWMKLLGFATGLLVATLGAHFWLIEQFNERPTALQTEKAFRDHGDTGHAGTQKDINVIRDTQTEQRVLLDGLKSTVQVQGQKLDVIIERLPASRGR